MVDVLEVFAKANEVERSGRSEESASGTDVSIPSGRSQSVHPGDPVLNLSGGGEDGGDAELGDVSETNKVRSEYARLGVPTIGTGNVHSAFWDESLSIKAIDGDLVVISALAGLYERAKIKTFTHERTNFVHLCGQRDVFVLAIRIVMPPSKYHF